MKARNMVVKTKYPVKNIAVPMLMYVLRENVTKARTTTTMLEM